MWPRPRRVDERKISWIRILVSCSKRLSIFRGVLLQSGEEDLSIATSCPTTTYTRMGTACAKNDARQAEPEAGAVKENVGPGIVKGNVVRAMIVEEEHGDPSSDLRPLDEYVWFWEEDADRVAQHHTWRQMGRFIAYPPKVSAHIERQYVDTMIEGGARVGASAPLEITYKVTNDHTGFNYTVDFTVMTQKNSGSGFQRSIRREANPHYQPRSSEEPTAPPMDHDAPVVVSAVSVTTAVAAE